MAYGVGVVGAGPGVAALHLPTLARLPDHYQVLTVTDAGSGRASVLARQWGASARPDLDALLAHPGLDVVAVCSPPDAHADQVRRCIEAGVGAILCEKPLATSVEAAKAAVVSARTAGVALLVGTNHHHDPAWQTVRTMLAGGASRVRTVSATVALPPNTRYHELVSEPAGGAVSTPGGTPRAAAAGTARRDPPDWANPTVAAAIVRQLVLGLAVHDLPAIRELAPEPPIVEFARPVPPIGYAIGFGAGDVACQLGAVMLPDGPDALWRLSIGTAAGLIDVDYPPAFVHAGGGTVRVRSGGAQATRHPVQHEDGYVREWRALYDLIERREPVPYDRILDDALYAIALADGAAAFIEAAA